jgi:hypothetical protein
MGKAIFQIIAILKTMEVNVLREKTFKISFLTKHKNLSPVIKLVPILNNIKAADLDSLGAMKVELVLRRSNYRKGKEFDLLEPVYAGTNKEIEDLIKLTIKREYPLIIS